MGLKGQVNEEVLNRIELPREVSEKFASSAWLGSALIVSDEAPYKETAAGNDFIVVLSEEPRAPGKYAVLKYEINHDRWRRLRGSRTSWAWPNGGSMKSSLVMDVAKRASDISASDHVDSRRVAVMAGVGNKRPRHATGAKLWGTSQCKPCQLAS